MPEVGEPDPWLPERLRRETVVREGEQRIAKAALRAIRSLLSALRNAITPDGGGLSVRLMDNRYPKWRAALEQYVMPEVDDMFGVGYREQVKAADWSPDPHVKAHLDEVRNRLVGVADEVFDLIRREINDGREHGESIPEIAARIDEVLADADAPRWHNRATVIARTETIAAYNIGHYAGAQDMAEILGVPEASVVKIWTATLDTHTRHTHREADNQHRLLLEGFKVGLAEMPMPGWAAGPPEEVIQCRCTMRFLFPGDPGYAEAAATSETPPAPDITPLDAHDAAAGANPKYDEFTRYQINCSNCVTAWDMRMRGHNVTAGPVRDIDAAPTGMEVLRRWYPDTDGRQIVRLDVDDPEADVRRVMSGWGPGARGVLIFRWREANFTMTGLTHVIAVYQHPTLGTMFLDPQVADRTHVNGLTVDRGEYTNPVALFRQIDTAGGIIMWRTDTAPDPVVPPGALEDG